MVLLLTLKSHFKENHMTRHELKERLNEICSQDTEILDVFFYKEGKHTMIVIPYVIRYKMLSPTLDVRRFSTAEEAVVRFYDSERLGTTNLDFMDVQMPTNQLERL